MLQARSTVSVKERRKKELQEKAHDAMQQVEERKVKQVEVQEKYLYASRVWEHYDRPRALQNMVSEKRKIGIEMPFTVSMVRGSRYASVEYGTKMEQVYFHHHD